MLHEFWENFRHNLFKPLLLFFYMGFSIPLLRVNLEYPHALYQAITMYLLIAIGWKGGEELASLPPEQFSQALGFMVLGFICNTIIGFAAYFMLRRMTHLRKIDAATVGGYYGSDSAGTFVTCVGVLATAHILYAPYMPVMLAVMEIPGCLVALFMISALRAKGMDAQGNMPDEAGYQSTADKEEFVLAEAAGGAHHLQQNLAEQNGGHEHSHAVPAEHAHAHGHAAAEGHSHSTTATTTHSKHHHRHKKVDPLLPTGHEGDGHAKPKGGFLNKKVLHEVFLNPGLFLLFAGIIIGALCKIQGPNERQTFAPGNAKEVTFLFSNVAAAKPLTLPCTAKSLEAHLDSIKKLEGNVEVSEYKGTFVIDFVNELAYHRVHNVVAADEPALTFKSRGGTVEPKLSETVKGGTVTADADRLFVLLFQPILCLFLLEMGITACKRLRDLRTAGPGFIAFALIAPNVFACFGIAMAHLYSQLTGHPFDLGTYVLFAVLCGAASYIAVPAVQRLAIPEASPTLPLAASLGLTFSYNVTIGIPLYIEIAKAVIRAWPVGAGSIG